MLLGRSSCAVVSLPGSILVVGGYMYVGNARTNTAGVLSRLTMIFPAGPTMLAAHSARAALALSQDHSPRRAFVVGGRDATSNLSAAEVLTA